MCSEVAHGIQENGFQRFIRTVADFLRLLEGIAPLRAHYHGPLRPFDLSG